MNSFSIVYYVSSHGFGHATRSAEIVSNLKQLHPSMRVLIRSAIPPQKFSSLCDTPVSGSDNYDVGVAQSDCLHIDINETYRLCQRWLCETPQIIRREVAFCKSQNAIGIVSDISSLPFRIAELIKVPSIGISNFTWDWIYEPWMDNVPGFKLIIKELRNDYAKASLFLKLPFSGQLTAFPVTESISLVGRESTICVDTVKKKLSLPKTKKTILLSFGGHGLRFDNTIHTKIPFDRYEFISTNDYGISCRHFSESFLRQNEICYQDLVKVSDMVITKPGYGIVSECIVNRTPILYTDRGLFREYPVLVKEMNDYIPALHIPGEMLVSGNWEPYIDRLFEEPMSPLEKPTDGAAIAAKRICDTIGVQ
ncbi:hypothetical protein JW979_09170 [bacterium]|nr:hypothetical protein [candidate division CSSED10-310 bacterium]